MKRHILVPMFVFVLLFAGCTLPGGNGEECPDTEFKVCGADGITYQNPCFAHKAGASVAHEGPCPALPGGCTDSDGGKDIFVASTILSGGIYESDYCTDASTVVEHFCLGSNSSLEEIPCPAGYSCDSGACKVLPCADSDGGMAPETKGTASSGPDSGTDSCIDESTLTEFYCKNGQVSSEEVECPANEHCSAGACIEFECTDSDGGQDADEAGTVEKGDVSRSDSCADSDTVKEYYCDAGEIKNENIDCESGEVCDGGECVSEPACEDSDGGEDRYEQGTTSYLGDSYTDACYSETHVIEYFCEGNEIENVKLVCGLGYTCSEGACVEVECEPEAEEFSEEDERHEIAEVDEDEELRLYAGDKLELDNDVIIQLVSFSEADDEASFLFFEDYAAFLDGDDDDCDDVPEEGSVECLGVNLTLVGIDTPAGEEDFVRVTFNRDYYAVQYTDSEWYEITWPDPDCGDDATAYVEQKSVFYPYLDTDSSGLDLDGETFIFFGMDAELTKVDVDDEEIEFEIDGEEYTLTDGEEFDYEDNTYDVKLEFNELGLVEMEIQLT